MPVGGGPGTLTKAEALGKDGLPHLNHVICGRCCPFPFLHVIHGVVAGACGIEEHAGLDGKGRRAVPSACLITEIPVCDVCDGVLRGLVKSHPPVKVELVQVVVDKLNDVLHNFVVAGLTGKSGLGVYDGNAAVHLQKLSVVVSLCDVGLGSLPAKVDAVTHVSLGLLSAVDAAVRVIHRAGVPVQGQELFPVLGVIQEEMRRADALIVVGVLV